MDIQRILKFGTRKVLNFHITYTYEGITIIMSRRNKKILRVIKEEEIINGKVNKGTITSKPYGRIK